MYDFYSNKSMFMYSTSTTLELEIYTSIIQCNTSQSASDIDAKYKIDEVDYNSTNAFYLSEAVSVYSKSNEFS